MSNFALFNVCLHGPDSCEYTDKAVLLTPDNGKTVNLWQLLELHDPLSNLANFSKIVKEFQSGPQAHFVHLPLLSDCIQFTIKIELSQLWFIFLPLCLYVMGKRERSISTLDRRFIVGLAGTAAAGKTVFCQLLRIILRGLGKR